MSEVAQAPHSSPDGRIPQLRFPEFDGVWESRLLKDAVKINPRSGELPDEFIYIDLESVKKGYLIKETQINKIGAPSRAQRLLNKNDVIFQTVRPYQKNNYFFNLDGDYVASTGYAQLRVLNSPEFLYQALHTDRFVYDVMARSTGTSYPAINSTDLSKIKLNLPTKPEQQKIAAFLTAVDNKIEQLSKKQELLGEYKKGLMQKIFSQAIRFKADDGGDYPDWEELKLGEVARFRRGSFPQPYGNPEWYDDEDGKPFVQVYDVAGNMRLKSTTKRKISVLAQSSSVFVPKGNVVLTIQGSIGRIALTQYDAYVDRTLLIFTGYIKEVNKQFFIYVIYLLFEIEKIKAPGGTIKTITKEALTSFKLDLPCFDEQTKIANFLSSIDSKIEQVGKQLDKSKQFKKALLQQMFV
jgi:type I restriction enzyme S subunit